MTTTVMATLLATLTTKSTTMWAAAWMAPTQGGTPQNHGPEFGGSSPIGLVVILVLAVAVVFLVRSMNKHLRKVPDSFDPVDERESASPGADTPGGVAGGAVADGPENTQTGPEGASPR